MPKKKKTRSEKIKSSLRQKESATFQLKEEWLETKTKKTREAIKTNEADRKKLRLDLTKTFLLSMLVLALELALWRFLSRH